MGKAKILFDDLINFVDSVIDNPDQDLDDDDLYVLTLMTGIYDELGKPRIMLPHLYNKKVTLGDVAKDIKQLRAKIQTYKDYVKPIKRACSQLELSSSEFARVVNGIQLANVFHIPAYVPLFRIKVIDLIKPLD